MVGVLIFVHHNIPKFICIIFKHVRVVLEQIHRVYNHIVKIHRVGLLKPLLIDSVKLGNRLLSKVQTRLILILGGRNKLVLSRGNRRKHRFMRQKLFIDIVGFHNVLHKTALVVGIVNRKVGGIAYKVGVSAQNFPADRVKCARPNVLRTVGKL